MTILCGECESAITTRKQAHISCDGLCEKQFHISCVSADPVDLNKIRADIPGLEWKCPKCTKDCMLINQRKINDVIEGKIAAVISSLMKEFTAIKAEITDLIYESHNKTVSNVSSEGTKSLTTYSEVLKNNTTPAVIIRPKNHEQTSSQTRIDILENINPLDTNLNISKVKEVKNGGILVGCKTIEENTKFKQMAEEKLAAYEVKEVSGVSPRIRIAGIREKFSEEVLLRYIIGMNGQLINGADCKVLKLSPTRKNKDMYQATLQVDRISYEKVMKAGNIFIGYDSCPVFDAVEILRCYNCNNFNHSAKHCSKDPSCPRCGENHSVVNCKSDTLKCSNCVSLSLNKNIDVPVNHAAWDTVNCAAYNQARERLSSFILQKNE